MATVVVVVHHGGGDSDERRGIRGGAGRGSGVCGAGGGGGGEIAMDLDGRELLQWAAVYGLFRQCEAEDNVITLLHGGEVGDGNGDAGATLDRLAGSGAACR